MARGYLFNATSLELYINNNRYSSKANDCVVIRDPKDLKERYGLRGLLEILGPLTKKYKTRLEVQDHWTLNDLGDHMWNMFKEICHEQLKDERRLKRASYSKDSGERGTISNYPGLTRPRLRERREQHYFLCYEAISQELCPTRRSKLPRQACQVLDGLRAQPSPTLSESEIMAVVRRLKDQGQLITKQEPERIFKYYEAKFHQMKLVLKKPQHA